MGMKQMDIILKYGISEGTLRTADLLESFMDAIKSLDPVAHSALLDEAISLGCCIDDDGEPDWEALFETDMSAADCFLWERVAEKLAGLAPKGYSFGSHIGNGSLYGFWKDEDTEEEEVE